MEVKRYLEDKYPHLIDRVYGDNYPPSNTRQLLASAISYVQMGGFVMVLFGDSIFQALSMPTPSFVTDMRSNMMPAFVGFMVLGSFSSNLLSTGAFEIYYNDQVVFSKLQAQRWPSMQELDALLQQHGLAQVK